MKKNQEKKKIVPVKTQHIQQIETQNDTDIEISRQGIQMNTINMLSFS